jgi:hypothetical protein
MKTTAWLSAAVMALGLAALQAEVPGRADGRHTWVDHDDTPGLGANVPINTGTVLRPDPLAK